MLAVAALAVYYATHNNSNEAAFVEQMGGAKPETEDFSVLRDQMERLDDEFHKQFDWDSFDTWGEFFWVQSRLLDLQRTYIAQCDANGEVGDVDLYNDAKDAVAAAAASVAAASRAAVAGTGTPPPPDPRCDNEREILHEKLYRNKHDYDGEGSHGYFRRAMEQMCGSVGPPLPGEPRNIWSTHLDQLRGMRNRSISASNRLNRLEDEGICAPNETFNDTDRNIIQKFRDNRGNDSTSRLWNPNNLPHYGREHPFCEGWADIARGDMNTLLQRLFRMTGEGL